MDVLSPEEMEYIKYKEKLRSLDEEFNRLTDDIQKLQISIDKFEKKFVNKLAKRYRILDTLDYKLSQYRKKRNIAKDKATQEKFDEVFKETEEKFKPFFYKDKDQNNKDIKSIYREIVKKIHPDKSSSPQEEKIRTELMSRVNIAYKENDKDTMLTLYNGWMNNPESIEDDEKIEKKLVKMIRLVYSKEGEVKLLRNKVEDMKSSELFQFKIEVDRFNRRGVDIMKEMAMSLDKEITLKKKVVRFFELLEDASVEKKNA